jgi:hypothetical protein
MSNPFSELRTILINQNKPAAIATRLAYCVLAAKDHRQAQSLLEVLDWSGGFMCTAYQDAFKSGPFRSNKAWHHTYDRLREHAISYLDTRHHRAYA